MDETNVKKLCVTQRGNKCYYPETIPRARSNKPISWCIFALAFILAVHYAVTSKKFVFFVEQYVIGFFVTFSSECLLRMFFLNEEKLHLISRYENKKLNLICDMYKFNNKIYMALVFCSIYLVSFLAAIGMRFEADANEMIAVMFAMYFLKYVLQLNSGPIYDSYWIEKDNGLDYGSGMAYSFYHGYLKFNNNYFLFFLSFINQNLLKNSGPIYDSYWIEKDNGLDYGSGMAYSFYHGYLKFILPKTGTEDKNIEEQITDYEDENQVKFGAHKIFILIPKSLKCPVSLCDGSKVMELRKSLKEKIITVAGVRDRVYKNSVYSIKTQNDKTVYVCAEYATPLKSFKDVVSADGDHNEYYKRHRNDILLQFYLTVKQVLQHNNLDKYCELVYYEDLDKEGRPHDVGQILLSRIKELYRQENN